MDNHSVSFFRKYRPRKVEELDITPVREFFGRVLESGKFAQAYLFTGPKGTGKTSAARILARTINCEKNLEGKGKLIEPCGKCSSCVGIENGSNTAVFEIDAASNRGIDDIRALRERVGLMPTEGKYSVFIIDEVHMLTKEAFNALLKTLEEPPKHVVFCLCTTDEHKLPDTVVSRCTRVVYRKATDEELSRSLKRVVAGEEIDIDDNALLAIAKKADGSFRDGVKTLEQLADGNKITLARIENEVGLSTGGAVLDLYQSIRTNNARESLEKLAVMVESGVDVVTLTKNLLELCRQDILESVKNNGQVDGRLIQFAEVFSKCFGRFGDVPIESLPTEMAIVEYCGAATIVAPAPTSSGGSTSSSGISQVQKPESRVIEQPKNTVKTVQNSDREFSPSTSLGIKFQKAGKNEEAESSLKIEAAVIVSEDEIGNSGSGLNLNTDIVRTGWNLLLSELASLNHGLVTILKGAQIKECHGEKLILGVAYKFHKDQLEQEKYLTLLESVAAKVYGGRVRLSIEINEKRKVSLEDEMVHENIAVLSPEDAALEKAAEEIFG